MSDISAADQALDRIAAAQHAASTRTNLQAACEHAAVELINLLHAEGSDFLLSKEEVAFIIYKNVHERTCL
jgi:hypothetical protein